MVGAELWCCWSAGNSIGDEGARDLGEKLQSNTTITSLDLIQILSHHTVQSTFAGSHLEMVLEFTLKVTPGWSLR